MINYRHSLNRHAYYIDRSKYSYLVRIFLTIASQIQKRAPHPDHKSPVKHCLIKARLTSAFTAFHDQLLIPDHPPISSVRNSIEDNPTGSLIIFHRNF